MTDAATDTQTQLLAQANAADSLRALSRDGAKLGYVHAFLIHKPSGRATHAVLSLGGILGMGKSFYPLPFELLAYDPAHDHYVVTVDRRLLEGGPSWSNNAPVFDQAYADRVASYYGVVAERLAVG